MRYAIFSDVHANWQAWSAVRDDLQARGPVTPICLGDVVGYGPQPQRVLQDVRACCDNLLLGNHEAAALGQLDLDIFTPEARRAAAWTATQLDGAAQRYLGALPMVIEDDDLLFVHAEPVAPDAWGYVETVADATACFEATQAQVIFVGHTHFPEVYTLTPDGAVAQARPAELTLDPGNRYLINVGSVGEPRDGTVEASYGLYDTDTRQLEFRRLPFDLDALAAELRAQPQLALPWFLQDLGLAALEGRRVYAIRVPRVVATPIRVSARRASLKVNVSLAEALASPAGPRTRPPALAPAAPAAPPARRSAAARPPRPSRGPGVFLISLLLAGLLAAAGGLHLWLTGRLAPSPAAPARGGSWWSSSDTILLPAQQAALAGGRLRLEQRGGQPVNIGFWTQPVATATWTVAVKRSGTYSITFVYALAAGAGANGFELRCGATRLSARLQPTGSWDVYRSAEVGRIPLAAGEQKLVIRANGQVTVGLMNLRAVELKRIN